MDRRQGVSCKTCGFWRVEGKEREHNVFESTYSLPEDEEDDELDR